MKNEKLDIAIQAARVAGNILKNFFPLQRRWSLKEGNEPVTDADVEAESAIVSIIEREYPTHGIIAEESESRHPEAEYLWHVDPLDGTWNFIRGIPFFCVSIGLAHKGFPELGVVYVPMSDELFIANKGKGCFLNEEKVRVSDVKRIREAIIGISDIYSKDSNRVSGEEIIGQTTRVARRVRILGSTVLDLAYIAAGRIDARIKVSSKSWDQVAGRVLVEEAGGALTDFEGHICDVNAPDYIASNSLLHAELLSLIKPFWRGTGRS